MARWLIALALCMVATPAHAQDSSGDPCAIPRKLTRIRPDPDGPPVRVEVGVFLIDLISLNEVEESFEVDFALSLCWRDPRLSRASRGSSLEDCRLTLGDVWHPQIDLINQRGVTVARDVDVDIDDDGVVRFNQRLTGALSSPLDVRQFPFDRQELRIRLASFEYGPEDVRFEVRESRAGVEDIAVPGWDVLSSVSDGSVDPVKSDVGLHAGLDHVITVERHEPYYVWKLVVPLVFIVLMAWCALWLDPTDYRPGIGVATASVFSLIAFLLGLRQMTPRVPYLTQMDELVLSVTLLVFLALGEIVIISRLVRRDRIDAARRVSRVARWIYLGAIVLVVMAFFTV